MASLPIWALLIIAVLSLLAGMALLGFAGILGLASATSGDRFTIWFALAVVLLGLAGIVTAVMAVWFMFNPADPPESEQAAAVHIIGSAA